MPGTIIRFGGNSFHKQVSLDAFIKLIKESKENLTIVVSAIPEITNILEEGIDLLPSKAVTAEKITEQIIESVFKSKAGNYLSTAKNSLSDELDKLSKLLEGIRLTGDYSPSLKDQVISFSERITSLVLLSILIKNKVDAEIKYPEEIELKASNEFGNASVIQSPIKFYPEKEGSHILIPSSYGVTTDGKIARLGGKAADYSAAAITSLIGADSLELWGVDREFRTGDLAIVKESEIIPRLTYEEASELSYFSKQSVHPRIVEPLSEKHIPIHIFRLNKKGKELTTTINTESFIVKNIVKSVVHDDEIAILKLNGPGVGFKPGILSRVTSAFDASEINIRSVITSQTSINVILNRKDLAAAFKKCEDLQLNSVKDFTIEDKVSLIAVVGQGMQQNHGISALLFGAIAQHNINVLLSGSGASDTVSYLIVSEKDKEKAVKEIHRTFFNN